MAFAESGRAKEDFETIDRVGTAWAYSAFLQQYPTGQYAGLAQERIALIARHPRPPRPPSAVTSPNYGDNYFMRRHLKLER